MIDIPTLLFCLASANLILAILMASHAPTSKTRGIIAQWSLARALQGCALLLLWQRDVLPDIIAGPFPGVLLILGLGLEMRTIARYWKEFRFDRRLSQLTLGAAATVFLIWAAELPPGWRIGTVSAFGIAAMLPVVTTCVRHWHGSSLLHRIITLSLISLLLTVSMRLGLAIWSPEVTLTASGLTQLLTFLPLTAFTILNGFGFIVAMYQRTERDLALNEATLERAQTIAQITSWSVDLRDNTLVTHRGSSVSRKRPLPEIVASIHPEDRTLVNHAWNRAVEGHTPYDILHRVVRRGRRRWLHSRAAIERDSQGTALRVTGVSHDVTDLREVQEALETYQKHLERMVASRSIELREAEIQTRLILESAAEGMIGIDTDGNIIFANRAACSLLGRENPDLIGCNAHATFHYRHLDGRLCLAEMCFLTQTLRTGKSSRCEEAHFWHADGHPFPVSLTSQPMLRNGQIVGAVLTFSDTSEQQEMRRARERALLEAQNLARARSEFIANMSHEIRTPLNAVLGLAQLGMRNNDPNHAHETFGRIIESGKHLLEIVGDILDFSKIEAGKLALEKGTVDLGQILDRAIDLTIPQASAKQLEYAVDEAVGLPKSFRGDATRLVQILVNLLGNAIKFTASGGISLAVSAETDELCFNVRDSGIGMSEEQQSRLFHAFEQADNTTTRRFGGTGLGLTISRHLVHLMGGSITVHSRLGKGSVFEVRIPLESPEYPPLRPLQSRRIVLAGLGSAETRQLADKLQALGAEVSGVEIDQAFAQEANAILLPNEKIHTAGTVAHCEMTVARGGEILISVPAGSPAAIPPGCRSIDRPLRHRHIAALLLGHAQSTAAMQETTARLSGVRILAAEDNAVNRLVLEEMLNGEGALLVCVDNGKEAVAQIRAGISFDIVLTDIQMPEMDGYEATRQILACAPDLPIIGLTAHAMPEEKARCLAAGMVAHLTKPIDIEELVAAIETHLGRRVTSALPAVVDEAIDTPSLAVIDLPRVVQRFRAHPGLTERLIRSMLRTTGDFPRLLRQHANRREHEAIAFIAHKLRGSASQLAAQRVEHLATQAELAARSARNDVYRLACELADALQELFALLEMHLHSLTTIED